MIWQARFNRKQRQIETELDGIKKYKINSDPSYKIIFDEELGKLFLYIHLETTESIITKERLIVHLQKLLNEDPPISVEAYSQTTVITSWKKEITNLLSEI